MAYRVQIKRSAAREIEALPRHRRVQIISAIESLARDPRPNGAVKLSGRDYYRLRAGDYRVVYEIADAVLIVYVIRVAHRKDVYRGI